MNITSLVNSLRMCLVEIIQVVLIDPSERFVFKPLLYELLSGGMLPTSCLM